MIDIINPIIVDIIRVDPGSTNFISSILIIMKNTPKTHIGLEVMKIFIPSKLEKGIMWKRANRRFIEIRRDRVPSLLKFCSINANKILATGPAKATFAISFSKIASLKRPTLLCLKSPITNSSIKGK